MAIVNGVPVNSQYVYAASLQQAFIDIRDGKPLSAGELTFYRDVDHSEEGKKPIYAVSGTPDDPEFIELPNPLPLSLIGTIIDPNNNQEIVPVFKPYDDEGNPDPYYIVIEASDGYPQGTRSNFPFVNGQGSNIIIQAQNIIPDGQFLFHQDIPDDGLITEDETPLCYGGWVFVRSSGTTSVNYVTFERFDTPIDSPEQNPRYAMRVRCTSPDPSDSQKDATLVISDCNFMQGQEATYQITAWSNDGNQHNAQIILRKTYGDTFVASAPTEEVIQTITVTPEIQNFLVSFAVSSNEGKVISDNDTDTFQLILRSPLSTVSDISCVDAIYVPGEYASLTYPPTSPEQAKAFAFPASLQTPAYDGSDLGKFVKLDYVDGALQTLGFVYDDPIPTGNIEFSGINSTTPPEGRLYCGGADYAVENGITLPAYPALFSKISYNFGTGINGILYGTPSGNHVNITWNRYDVNQAVPDAGTSGFTFNLVQASIATTQPQIYQLAAVAGSSIPAGAYFRILINTTGVQFVHLYWFTVNGAGSIPNVTFDASKRIDILSTDTAAQVATKIKNAGCAVFAVPDGRGRFPRIWNNGAGRDPDSSSRTATAGYPGFPYLVATGNSGDNVGSVQGYQVQSHTHIVNDTAGPNTTADDVATAGGWAFWKYNNLETTAYGGNETRPTNIYFNAFIKT